MIYFVLIFIYGVNCGLKSFFAFGYLIVKALSVKKAIIFYWILLVLLPRINTSLILFPVPLFDSINLYVYPYANTKLS